jgi:hypothetical protein
MASYSTIHINITFKENTPSYVTDFFQKGTQNERLPTFLYEMGLTFDNKINLITPDMLLCEYGAKTYTEGKPNNRYYLSFSQEYDLDSYILSIYPFVVFLAAYSENTQIAGYIKEEWGPFNVFSFQDGLAYWQQDLKIENISKEGKLDYYELLTIGIKIKYSEGTEAEISKMMGDFDKSVPRPNGSNLFFYPENYDAKSDDISSYDPSVEEVVEKCLSYKPIQL